MLAVNIPLSRKRDFLASRLSGCDRLFGNKGMYLAIHRIAFDMGGSYANQKAAGAVDSIDTIVGLSEGICPPAGKKNRAQFLEKTDSPGIMNRLLFKPDGPAKIHQQ